MSSRTHLFSDSFLAVFAGVGIGVLIGLIAGLSVSPVVSVILGALASLLGAFLGLQGGGSAEELNEAQLAAQRQRMRLNAIKAGGFGVACIAGILGGLFIRSNQALMPTPEEQIEKYVQAGLEEDYARKLWVFEKFGLPPEGGPAQYAEVQKSHSNALFAGSDASKMCDEINTDRLGNDVHEILNAYRLQDHAELSSMANAIEKSGGNEAQQFALIQATTNILCKEGKQK